MSYKDTLNLPKTSFSMRANLPQKEPAMLKEWGEKDIYAMITKARHGSERVVLHDGPPYANGNIHMGHVLNKILKDMVVKFYTMKGFDSPFVPGWDCHGLPVEHQLFKELKMSKDQIPQSKFRSKAKDYALKYVKIQKEEFKRLGVFGDWEKPYLTLDPKYEAVIVRSFARLVKDGYIYRDLKPVNWCTTCETALAEAEVEYEDRSSPSIYVKFRIQKSEVRGQKETYFIIWTTTPWTLLGNVGIAVHPDMDYVFLDVDGEEWVMLEALATEAMAKFNKTFKIIKKVKGKELENTICRHPFIDRDSKVVLATYVSSEEGTGCVHTAPGHGQEDYLTGKKYDLPIVMPVDEKGNFDNTCGEFSGLNVHKANEKILERMKKDGALLASERIAHSYPHCWRCKNPIIFRATEQYFMNVDHNGLRQKLLNAIKEKVKWYPEMGETRISAMVAERPDWCLSRQRYWGVPIIAFKCKKCKEILLDVTVIEHVAGIIEKEGTNVWFIKSEKELLPKGSKCKKCGSDELMKEKDIIDVWFESGVSHQAVLKEYFKLGFPCRLYLEGSDQHRGWFQSALITACAIDGSAPYAEVLTHGFVVDGAGKKMSKSLGNVISPQDVMKKYGADILRLWVASSNYQDDVRLSEEILQRLADAYRKIRNTLRFLLGNLNDFDPDKDSVPADKMLEIDRWMLSRLAGLIERADSDYSNYNFHKFFRVLYNFCVYEVSSLYLDILKDRLYTSGKNSVERRSCQTALSKVLEGLLKVSAPILAFTAEEAWQHLGTKKEESVHLAKWEWSEDLLKEWKDEELDKKWSGLLEIREEVLKAIEVKRMAGEVGSSLEAKVVLYSDKKDFMKLLKENMSALPAFFIVSQVEIASGETGGMKKCEKLPLGIEVKKADGDKCPRCWIYSVEIGKNKEYFDICPKCIGSIKGNR